MQLSYPTVHLNDLTNEKLKDYFLKTYELYEHLFSAIRDQRGYYEKAIAIRHPLIFYFGHTAVFFVNKMLKAGMITDRINANYESIFAIGVDEMSWDDVNSKNYEWPSVIGVVAYREKVKDLVCKVIDDMDMTSISDKHPAWIILMGIEHERIHLETSSVLIRQLPIDYVQDVKGFSICPVQSETVIVPELVDIEAGTVSIEHHESTTNVYGWDNEFGSRQVELKSFKASNMLVTNLEFLGFVIDAHGYTNPDNWTDEGKAWLEYSKSTAPTFWVRSEDETVKYRTMTSIIDMPWDWPVEVNYLEAKAYTNWLAKRIDMPVRLPTEDEYLLMRQQAGITGDSSLEYDANVNLKFASPCPVNMHQHGNLFDVVGNVWQWTETPIYPFYGFRVHPHYDDFSVPTFDDRHNIMKGGSWISTGNEANLHSRYAFRRHFFQHAGFRFIISEDNMNTKAPIETEADVVSEILSQYDKSAFGFQNFERELADQILARRMSFKNVLEIGCSVGRLGVALAPHCRNYTATDTSARFIRIGDKINSDGILEYRDFDGETRIVELTKLGALPADHLNYIQQNPENLKPIYTGYDLIIVNMALEKMVQPAKFLANISSRLNEGGLLVMVNDFVYDQLTTSQADEVSESQIIEHLGVNFFKAFGSIELVKTKPINARNICVRNALVSFWQKDSFE